MIKQIKTEKFEGLAVMVPEDANDFELSFWNYQRQMYLDTKSVLIFESRSDRRKQIRQDRPHVILPENDYLVLGKATELTEERCAEIVPSIIPGKLMQSWGIKILYPMFNSEKKSLNASTAFSSLMEFVGATQGTWLILEKCSS